MYLRLQYNPKALPFKIILFKNDKVEGNFLSLGNVQVMVNTVKKLPIK